MTPLVWSLVLALFGLVGLILAGRQLKVGWLIGAFAQVLWLVYALLTGQYGFILTAVAYAAVYLQNWWRWRRSEQAAKVQAARREDLELAEARATLARMRRPRRLGSDA
jgi:nicotinamide riboside transporter PnuC